MGHHPLWDTSQLKISRIFWWDTCGGTSVSWDEIALFLESHWCYHALHYLFFSVSVNEKVSQRPQNSAKEREVPSGAPWPLYVWSPKGTGALCVPEHWGLANWFEQEKPSQAPFLGCLCIKKCYEPLQIIVLHTNSDWFLLLLWAPLALSWVNSKQKIYLEWVTLFQ